jgi:cyclophilin family peptidyl-prolyl cis-trans isomerase
MGLIGKVTLTLMLGLVMLILPAGSYSQKKDKPKEGTKSSMAGQKVHGSIETSMGTIEVEFYPNDAPKTVENFVRLAEKKYFDGVIFHRVSKGFVIQGGDPTGTGSGGSSIWGKEFEDELNPNTPSYNEGYKKGVVAMANRGPNTNTSQFFIMLRDIPTMPKNYTIFGKVVKGMDVVEKIGAVEITPQMGPSDGKPKVDVVMKKVTIKKEGGGGTPERK